LIHHLGENPPTVKLELILPPKYKVHKHIVIAVSGFLSEDANQENDWKYLVQLCKS
jgi:hypothetical protein